MWSSESPFQIYKSKGACSFALKFKHINNRNVSVRSIRQFISFQNSWNCLIASPISFDLICGSSYVLYSLNRVSYIVWTWNTSQWSCTVTLNLMFHLSYITWPLLASVCLDLISLKSRLILYMKKNEISWVLKKKIVNQSFRIRQRNRYHILADWWKFHGTYLGTHLKKPCLQVQSVISENQAIY